MNRRPIKARRDPLDVGSAGPIFVARLGRGLCPEVDVCVLLKKSTYPTFDDGFWLDRKSFFLSSFSIIYIYTFAVIFICKLDMGTFVWANFAMSSASKVKNSWRSLLNLCHRLALPKQIPLMRWHYGFPRLVLAWYICAAVQSRLLFRKVIRTCSRKQFRLELLKFLRVIRPTWWCVVTVAHGL